MSGSPRRFANQGLVYLSEIQTLEEVNELSVNQAKDILAMNRVNFILTHGSVREVFAIPPKVFVVE